MFMKNLMKEKMAKGEKTLGLMFESGSTTMTECIALAGLDYIIIDTEHGPFEAETVMELVCTAARRNMTPLVRVKEISRPAILKMLDVGAMGLIIPCVNTVEEIKKIVSYGKYFPQGNRGVAFARGMVLVTQTLNRSQNILRTATVRPCLFLNARPKVVWKISKLSSRWMG
jgi:4-hydroxy-2-oxoheptanedioate aldolase